MNVLVSALDGTPAEALPVEGLRYNFQNDFPRMFSSVDCGRGCSSARLLGGLRLTAGAGPAGRHVGPRNQPGSCTCRQPGC